VRLALAFALLSMPALAGERLLGKIVSGAGADTSNDSTATPFRVPNDAKITVVCTATAYVLTDSATAVTDLTGANPGMPVTANEKFPTSTGTMTKVNSGTAANGGAYVRIMGPAAVNCWVFERRGNE